MAALGLEAVADRRVGQLSGGDQRRVNLGAALRVSPDVLVLDEPVGLDRDAKAILLDAVRAEARRGAAVLLITHDIEAAAMADRIGVLVRGRIVAGGEAAAPAGANLWEPTDRALPTYEVVIVMLIGGPEQSILPSEMFSAIRKTCPRP